MDEEQERRKRIQIIKRIIVATFVILLILPTFLCGLLLNKVHHLEGEVNDYKETINIIKLEQNDVVGKSQDILDSIEKLQNQKYDAANNESATQKPEGEENKNKNTGSNNNGNDNNGSNNSQSVPLKTKRVYLTFDDGPSKYTNELLDTLAKNNVKATFFVTGKAAENNKELVKRMYDEGHTVGMHSYSHDYNKIYSSVKEFTNDLNKVSGLIESITGEKPKYYRFPGGSSNTISENDIFDYIDVLDKKNIVYVDWNAANMDATGAVLTSEELIDNILEGIKNNNNSVVLMHDTAAKKATIESIPKLIKELNKRGYVLLPIDEDAPLVQHVSAEDR